MRKVHRLIVRSGLEEIMIEEFNMIIENGVQQRDVHYFSQFVPELMSKYSVCEKTIYNRFRSVYGNKPREIIKEKIIPPTDVIESAILNTDNSDDFFNRISISGNLRKGFFDKFFGVSTFQKAKIVVLGRKMKIEYRPNIQDNRSIIYSQVLGDGHYDRKRHSIKIVHGIKQAEYLRWKVSLIYEAYPESRKYDIKNMVHSQGHQYVSFYFGLGNVDIIPEEQMVNKLTPLGWLLWYLDDGYCGQNFSICCKRNYKVRENAIKELKTYGIDARMNDTSVIMKGQENDMRFYKNFISPFKSKLPTCMLYKCQTEDIVEMIID